MNFLIFLYHRVIVSAKSGEQSGIGFCMGSMDPYIIKVFKKSLYPWEKVIVGDIIWLDLEFC
jgi:hypothetical protein